MVIKAFEGEIADLSIYKLNARHTFHMLYREVNVKASHFSDGHVWQKVETGHSMPSICQPHLDHSNLSIPFARVRIPEFVGAPISTGKIAANATTSCVVCPCSCQHQCARQDQKGRTQKHMDAGSGLTCN